MSSQCKTEHSFTPKTVDNESCCDMPEKLLALADEAWHELLKEKIKAEMAESCEGMEKLAKLVTETNKAKWSHEIYGKVKCEEYKNKLKDLFTEGASCHSK